MKSPARGAKSGLAGDFRLLTIDDLPASNPAAPPLKLFSVVIPARDEEESLPATVEHLHLELFLNHVPHEIVVVDDGSKDHTWEILQQLKTKIPTCARCRTPASTALAARSCIGLRHCQGDAVVIMMADESDDAATWCATGNC